MQYRPLGQSGIEASVIAFGAWGIGGWWWGGADADAAVDAIHAAIDSGINFIDSAPMYGFGRSEELVGRAIQGRRDKVVLATKCGMRWDLRKGNHFFDTKDPDRPDAPAAPVHRYLGPESIREEVERSLTRLRTDYIDLYQTHWQDPTTPIEETMAALMQLKQEGKIRAIGVSNANSEEMDRYRSVGPLDCDQERYSLLDRNLDAEQLPYAREHSIAMLAYSPLRNGLLTGKITPDQEFSETDMRRNQPYFTRENREKIQAMLGEMKLIADRSDLTVAQLVIAWTIAQPGLTHALVGARSRDHVASNAKAGSVTLSPEALQAVDGIYARHAPSIV